MVSSRPSSRGSTKSLPVLTHTVVSPNFPCALHRNFSSVVHTDTRSTAHSFAETLQSSRLGMASSVLMPASGKEHHRRLLTSKSSPNLRYRASAPSSSTAWPGSGFIGGSSSIDKAGAVLLENVEQIRTITSPLASEVPKRSSALGSMSFGTQSTDSVASMSPSHSRSVSSFSSVGESELDSFPSPPSHILTFGFAQNPRRSIIDCRIIDEAAEEDTAVSLGPTLKVLSPVETTKNLLEPNMSGQHTRSVLNDMHSRAIFDTDAMKPESPNSFTTIPAVAHKHMKGLSFLSFTSSDDSHTPLVPALPDGIPPSGYDSLNYTPQKEALYESQPVPCPAPIRKEVTPIIHSSSSFSNRRSLNPKFRGRKMLTLLRPPPHAVDMEANRTPPPTSPLPFPPSPSSCSSQYSYPATPVSPFSLMGMLAPPSPTWARSRTDKAVRILGLDSESLSFGGGFDDHLYNSSSTLDMPADKEPIPFPTQSSNKSEAGSSLGFDGDDPTYTPSFSRRSLKAMSLLGVREPPLVGPPRLHKSTSLLGFGGLGDTTGTTSMGEPGVMMQNKLDLHMDTTLGFGGARGTLKTGGTMKKLWKNLTGTGGREAGKETGRRA